MQDKKVYMKMDDNSRDDQQEKNIAEKGFEKMADFGLDKMLDNISVNMVDDMAQILMPEPTLALLIGFFKKLEQGIEQGLSR
ncbi:MAG: hypothetical protein Q7S59_07035 [Sulfurimonas sp.]|nr:hypothetical protein [Sulfurimonas sp.]